MCPLNSINKKWVGVLTVRDFKVEPSQRLCHTLQIKLHRVSSLQVMRHDNSSILELDGKEVSVFTPSKPREKWLRKRTHVKIRVSAHLLL